MRRVLFLCTGNCVRSQMAEALLRHRGAGVFEACSAGSHPAGFVHPLAVEALRELGIRTRGMRSESWREYEKQAFDAIITLCEDARDAIAPLWPAVPGQLLPVRAHWGFSDPSKAVIMGDAARLEEFRRSRNAIRAAVERLALAPRERLADDAWFARLVVGIGEGTDDAKKNAGEQKKG